MKGRTAFLLGREHDRVSFGDCSARDCHEQCSVLTAPIQSTLYRSHGFSVGRRVALLLRRPSQWNRRPGDIAGQYRGLAVDRRECEWPGGVENNGGPDYCARCRYTTARPISNAAARRSNSLSSESAGSRGGGDGGLLAAFRTVGETFQANVVLKPTGHAFHAWTRALTRSSAHSLAARRTLGSVLGRSLRRLMSFPAPFS